ncbi:MAG: N-methyl-L-tryptophan oxidase [Pseudomonadota bacterium]
MPATHYDIAVIGSGVIGAAVAWQCAERGQRTLILDRHPAPHTFGSSHGQTRLLRVAYAEGEHYVPLVRRSIRLWRALEKRTGQAVFRQSGVVYVGQEYSPLIAGVRAAAAAHDVRVREIDGPARATEMPELEVSPDWTMLIEDEGGYLYAEAAVRAMLALGKATIHLSVRLGDVAHCQEVADGVSIGLRSGEEIRAARAVVCAGAWVGDLLPGVGDRVQPHRQLSHWFDGDPKHFGEDASFRPFGVNDARANTFYYGFPRIDKLGVKVGDHFVREPPAHADDRRMDVTASEVAATAEFARQHLPRLGRHLSSRSCLYTCTVSEDFILDWAPAGAKRIYVCSGFSGHGFKFAPAIGEAVAQRLLGELPSCDISSFGLGRPTAST